MGKFALSWKHSVIFPAASSTPVVNTYVTEDGLQEYVIEDGTQPYVPEA